MRRTGILSPDPSEGANVTDPDVANNLRTAYDELCITYRAIDDFRAKLLGFLPLVTGGGLVLAIGKAEELRRDFFGPIGIFGIAVTAGLLAYELFCIKKCHALLRTGEDLEGKLRLPVDSDGKPAGQFIRRPNNLLKVVNEPFAAALIYPAVLAAWTYLACYPLDPNRAPGVSPSVTVFVVGCLLIVLYDQSLKDEGFVPKLLKWLPFWRKDPKPQFGDKILPEQPDGVAPNGSEVRILCAVDHGGMAHFKLTAGQVSRAVVNRAVDEIWYIISGVGSMWRQLGADEAVLDLRPGVSLTIPVGTRFQFRNVGTTPLEAVGITMPPSPGDQEAVVVDGQWPPTVQRPSSA
jgi:mannose-6-phosphate isomerase-like protein (cupin superfamily)